MGLTAFHLFLSLILSLSPPPPQVGLSLERPWMHSVILKLPAGIAPLPVERIWYQHASQGQILALA